MSQQKSGTGWSKDVFRNGQETQFLTVTAFRGFKFGPDDFNNFTLTQSIFAWSVFTFVMS